MLVYSELHRLICLDAEVDLRSRGWRGVTRHDSLAAIALGGSEYALLTERPFSLMQNSVT